VPTKDEIQAAREVVAHYSDEGWQHTYHVLNDALTEAVAALRDLSRFPGAVWAQLDARDVLAKYQEVNDDGR